MSLSSAIITQLNRQQITHIENSQKKSCQQTIKSASDVLFKIKVIIDSLKHHFSVIIAEDQKQQQLTDSDEEDIVKIKEK